MIDPAGNRKLVKRSATQRIDGIVALSMVCGLAARVPGRKGYQFAGRELALSA